MDQLTEGETYMTTSEYHNYHTKASNYTINGTHKREVTCSRRQDIGMSTWLGHSFCLETCNC